VQRGDIVRAAHAAGGGDGQSDLVAHPSGDLGVGAGHAPLDADIGDEESADMLRQTPRAIEDGLAGAVRPPAIDDHTVAMIEAGDPDFARED